MNRPINSTRAIRYLVIIIGGTLAGFGLSAIARHTTSDQDRVVAEAAECAHLTRIVTRRDNSMLSGKAAYHATENRIYRVCLSDPAAFKRLVR